MNKNGSVILALNNTKGAELLSKLITNAGHNVLDVCKSGSEALRVARRLQPNLLIVNYDLPDTTGLEIARIIAEDQISTVLVLVNSSQRQYFEKINKIYDITCIVKPFKKLDLLNTIQILLRNNRKIRELEYEVNHLKNRIEAKKIIDKAKYVLINMEKMHEDEAHRLIQKTSMDTGIPMKEVAEKILERYNDN